MNYTYLWFIKNVILKLLCNCEIILEAEKIEAEALAEGDRETERDRRRETDGGALIAAPFVVVVGVVVGGGAVFVFVFSA